MAVWVGPPRSYTPGRPRGIQYVVIHATDGPETPDSAEAGARYDKIRTDGVSTHLFVDSDSAVREVADGDQAHAAFFHANVIGIHVELCGSANQSGAQWRDAASWPELQLAAREVAALCVAHGLDVRRLSVAEVRAAYYAPAGQRPTGICGHVDVTEAYPEDNGDHTDPGPGFPWADFLAMVATAAGHPTTPKDDDMRVLINAAGQGYLVYGQPDPTTGNPITVPVSAAAVADYRSAGFDVVTLPNVNPSYYAIKTPPLSVPGPAGPVAAHTHTTASATGPVAPEAA